jgi:hypothetical protein
MAALTPFTLYEISFIKNKNAPAPEKPEAVRLSVILHTFFPSFPLYGAIFRQDRRIYAIFAAKVQIYGQ